MGPPEIVAPDLLIVSSQRNGFWRNVAGAMRMLVNAGEHRREDAADEPHVVVRREPEDGTSCRFGRSKALLMARVLATRLAWLSITPLGWLVEPDVYWIIARESRRGIVLDPAVGVGVGELVGGEPADRGGLAGHRLELGDRRTRC